MELTFNIIYTPNTVSYLTFFVHSLLRWSDCSFRLVTNGCSLADEHKLRAFCSQNPRLEFYRLPTDRVIEHGVALNHLQGLTHEDKFCFMDSDIYATGEFVPEFLALCRNHAAVFSCSPIWCKAEDQVNRTDNPIMVGEFNRTDRGHCLGNTYFALYDNAVLTSFRQKHGIGFDRLGWQNIPQPQQQRLRVRALQKEHYDTGKVLNLLLQDEGATLLVSEATTLQHLGGVSIVPIERQKAAKQKPKPLGHNLGQRLTRKVRLFWHRLWQPDYYRFSFSKRRAIYKVYFHDLLVALHENRTPPPLPRIGDPALEAKIETAKQQMIELFAQSKHDHVA